MKIRIRMVAASAWLGVVLIPTWASAQRGEESRRDRGVEASKRAEQQRERAVQAAKKAAQARTAIRFVAATSPSGLEFAEVSDAIRAQLDIPEDAGVVIVNVRPGSPAMKAGFQANDLLLAVDGEAIRGVAQAREALGGNRDEEIKAKVIRAGKEEELALKIPKEDAHRELAKRPFLAFEATGRGEYWIGVPVSPVDPTLRSHLTSLPAEAGLIVNDVAPGSPAEKVGLKKNDVLVTMDGKPLASPRTLVDRVQASEGKPVPLEYLRGGKLTTVKITPEKQEGLAEHPFAAEMDHFIFRGPGQVFRIDPRSGMDPNLPFSRDGRGFPGPAVRDFDFRARFEGAQAKELEAVTKRLEDAIKEMTAKVEEVRKSVEQLQKADGDEKPKDQK